MKGLLMPSEGYHDWFAGEDVTDANVEDYLMLQAIMRFASAAAGNTALASVLIEGLRRHLKDVNSDQIYSGAAWSTIGPLHGALTAFTPTVTQSGSVTVTVTAAAYQRVGRWVQGWFTLTVTGSGTANNAIIISGIPAAAGAGNAGLPIGSGLIYDASNTNSAYGILCHGSTTTFDIRQASAANSDLRMGLTGNLFAAALAAGDLIYGTFAYVAATDA